MLYETEDASSPFAKKSKSFNEKLEKVTKIMFTYGGYFSGEETTDITFPNGLLNLKISYSMMHEKLDCEKRKTNITKQEFIEKLKGLYIGEWRKNYDSSDYNVIIMDGNYWSLDMFFEDGIKPLKISGSNAYPYNFNEMTELIKG